MTKLTTLALIAVSATGCFVELDAPSVVIERTCDRSASCTFGGSDRLLERSPVPMASGAMDFELDLGEQDILQSEYGIGPIELSSQLVLEQLVLTTLDGVAVNGMTSAVILRGDGQTIASFDGSPTAPDELVLVGNTSINLLDLGTKFTLRLEATGRPPEHDWMASFSFVTRLRARAD